MKNVGKILTPEQRIKLEQLQKRAKSLTLFGHAPDGRSWNEYCSAQIQETLDWDKEPDKDPVEIAKLYKRAHAGDIDARMELQAIRLEQTQNYLIPILNFGRFFEIVSLKDNEAPFIQNNTKQEFKAKYIGQDGRVESTKVVPVQSETAIDLKVLTTDEATYMLRDIYTGDVTKAAQATFDLNFDLQNQLEALLKTLLDTAFGNFTLTGNKAARVYNPNSRIASGVLPTSNDLSIPSISGSTTLGQSTFDAIIDYCVRFGRTDAGTNLMPTGELIVPSQDVIQVGAGISLTATGQNGWAHSVAENGWLELPKYLGVNWRLVPDNTIAQKKCYVPLNRPVGKLFLKPSMDQDEEELNKKLNKASRWLSKVVGMYIAEPMKRNVLRVAYRT